MKNNIVDSALLFASSAHGAIEQKRKYSGENYIVHPIEVMQIVRSLPSHTDEMLIVALLHDVVEDTEVKLVDIAVKFGAKIAEMVAEITDVSEPEDGNRAVRKGLDREHLAKARAEVQTVKLADIISNSKDILQNDPNFAKVYIPEMKLLLEELDKGDQMLYQLAKDIVYSS